MPPASEPTLASPDIRPLRPHYPFLEGLRTIGVMAIFFFAQTYFPKWFFHGITSAYTLNAEVIFYLVLPAYAFGVRWWCRGRSIDEKLRRELYALAFVVIGSFAWRVLIEWRYDDIRRTCVDDQHGRLACAATQWFPGYADYFAL